MFSDIVLRFTLHTYHKIDHRCTVKSCSDSDKSSLPPPLMGLSWDILMTSVLFYSCAGYLLLSESRVIR
jgi:hypothetical protein